MVTGFKEVQDYVEVATRQRIAELPDGTWETEDYIDSDPALEEGLIPIKVKLTIKGDEVTYDFTGSHGTISTLYNSAFGATFSAVVAGMKTYFPDLPLNSGFYRPINVIAPEGSIVDAKWPVAVTGFLMPFEKIMNSIYEIWSDIIPERAIACAFNLEYLLTGGRDLRTKDKSIFMFYDWLPGGWGGRSDRDGCNVTTACFGTGLMTQPVEGQERLCPIVADEYQILCDSPGPGKFRGGAGVIKTSTLGEASNTVISYICDRERAIVWGIKGGLPSMPHGLWVERNGAPEGEREWLGSIISDVAIEPGDRFGRPTAGGGGLGDPLERDVKAVLRDVEDDYVSVERAAKDYGVVLDVVDADLAEYKVDREKTNALRKEIAAARRGWIDEDAESVAARYRSGELNSFDMVRRYAVIVDWGDGTLLPKTTAQFREMFRKRSAAHWNDSIAVGQAAE